MLQVRALAGVERWAKRVRLRKDKTHFLFTIQATGQLLPEQVFCMALDELSHKADKVLDSLEPGQ